MIIGTSGKANSGKDTVGKIIQWLVSNSTIPFNDWNTIHTNSRNSYSHWQIIKFADKVKDIVCLMIGCIRKELEDEEFKNKELGEEWDKYECYSNEGSHFPRFTFNTLDEYNIFKKSEDASWYDLSNVELIKLTPRKLMQLIGTDVGRVIHPNTWINATMKDYKGNAFEFTNGTNHIKKMGNLPYTVKNLAKVGVTDYKMVNYPNWIITDCRFPNEIKAIEDRDGFVIRVERFLIPQAKGNGYTTPQPHESETALDNYKFKYTITNDGTIDELIEQVKLILIVKDIL